MEILFLGTSAGWPLPRLGCKCQICTSTDPKDKRLRPSLLINRKILIDASPDIYHQLVKYEVDVSKLTHIFITHPHADHVIGLYDLSHIYNRSSKLNREAGYSTQNSKIKLVATKGILSRMKQLVGVSMMSFKMVEIRPFENINPGNDSSATLIPVEHGNIEAYGIKVKAPKPAFYAPEFRKILPSSKKEIGDVDLAIIDGSSKTSSGRAAGHETIEEGIRLGREIHAKKILFTNIGHKTDTHSRLEQFVKGVAGQKFGIAFDGLELKL